MERIDDKIKWACRRGLLELDIIFKDFRESHLKSLSLDEKKTLLNFLKQSDHDIWDSLNGKLILQEDDIQMLLKKYF